jgi:hypothetical protein
MFLRNSYKETQKDVHILALAELMNENEVVSAPTGRALYTASFIASAYIDKVPIRKLTVDEDITNYDINIIIRSIHAYAIKHAKTVNQGITGLVYVANFNNGCTEVDIARAKEEIQQKFKDIVPEWPVAGMIRGKLESLMNKDTCLIETIPQEVQDALYNNGFNPIIPHFSSPPGVIKREPYIWGCRFICNSYVYNQRDLYE